MDPVVMNTLAWLRAVAPAVFAQRRDLQLDSRKVQPGDVFLAFPGAAVDGRGFIDVAVRQGAAAVIVEANGWNKRNVAVPLLPVPHLRSLLGALAASFYGHPSTSLLSVGVTGTNGKTSCSQWIAQLLTRSGRRCAVIGTIGIGFTDEPFTDSSLTTPDPVSLQREVRRLLDAGAQALAMEVSSIGLDQGRVTGMKFDVALYTNLTRDHLDYHGTMERYEAAKAVLFDWPTLSHAVINVDDAAAVRLIPRLLERGVRTIGFSATGAAGDRRLAHMLTAENILPTADGLGFLAKLDGAGVAIEVPVVGHYNIANLLGVAGVALACGVNFAAAVAALPHLAPPLGRMQRVVRPDAPLAVVDYAHTPDALAQALQALRPLAESRRGRIWVVFGAGGDRDQGKRAPMGAAAASGADVVIVTSDNPRTEDPSAIVAQVALGARGARELICLLDRSEAIAHAVHRAAPEDIVLVAGKGHEEYQVIGTHKQPYSDLAQVRAALSERGRR
ncbi:MAG TPA: UDP-N-acetylmuramoyl-L-alanyl-D-glutamate--2,6-diaminopimelate ligase [Burkholderiaceae bacterium]|nr:UDP-N-acetylmuramoyl-L-alanyl-D-glutamate--2,6-diaminopimelate ligase [Burkholderiaceae bacterium]